MLKWFEYKLRLLRKYYSLFKSLYIRARERHINDVIFEELIASRNCQQAFVSLNLCYSSTLRKINNSQNLLRYLELIRPITHIDLKLKRFGAEGDGGYRMLPPPSPIHINSGVPPKLLSLGVSCESPFDLEMANMGYKVIEFDGSIEKSPYDGHENIEFVRKFIGMVDNENVASLEKILSESSFNPKYHNILQCDIEGAEWNVMEHIDMNLITKNFSQIIFEFHNCYPDDTQNSQRHFEILEKINKYYVPIWTHYNSIVNLFICNVGNTMLTFCPSLEISYLRKDLVPSGAKPVGFLANEIPEPNDNRVKPDIPVLFPPL